MAVLKYYNTATSAWEYIAASTTANFTTWKKTMSGGETSVSGTDDNGVTLSYTVGLEQVFINGALQARGSDYVATTGTSVTGLSALSVNDIVSVVCYAPFNVANTYTQAQTNDVAAAAAGLRMVVPTSVSVGSGSGSVDANGAVTFTGASSISLNGCFTSVYDNYYLSIKFTPSTAITATIRFRTSGTDNTASTYKYIMKNFSSASADETYVSRTGTSTELNRDTGTSQFSYEGVIRNPMLAVQTHLNLTGTLQVGNYYLNATGFDNTTLFDGFSLIASTGNFTGTIRVYGYKN